MKQIILFLSIILFLQSCIKEEICTNEPCLGGDYSKYTTTILDSVNYHMPFTGPIEPSIIINEKPYAYPIFNPNNPYEILYLTPTSSADGGYFLNNEIWKFSFCDGEKTKLADNFLYNLDWGSNGWVIYTGFDNKIYKVKDNGDSLAVLSAHNGFNRAGKWNPSGTMFWNDSDEGYFLEDINGDLVQQISPSGALNWINDSTLLVSLGAKLNSYSIKTGVFTELNSTQAGIPTKIFDREKMEYYIPYGHSQGNIHDLVKYSLDGSNRTDTIRQYYDSYSFNAGSYANNKLAFTLVRREWIGINKIEERVNILLMNSDGTNDMLVNIP